jgi:hypothetical protein
VSEPSKEDLEFLAFMSRPPFRGAVNVYPNAEEVNQRGIAETCQRLESAGMMRSREVGDGVFIYEVVSLPSTTTDA